MTMKNIKKWLQEPCDEKDIRYINGKIAYIPIGIIENYLDEIGDWETENFKFNIYKTSNLYIASGSVELILYYDGTIRTMVGACSLPISIKDDNLDYEATILSFCIANAAKKLGKKFGRHLNGRLDEGETGISIKINKETIDQDIEIKKQYDEIEKTLIDFKYQEQAQEYLDTTSFKHFIPAKQIVNSKPLKNKKSCPDQVK